MIKDQMEIVRKYFPGLDEGQIAMFAVLSDLYREWNGMINVISRKDIDHLYERHVLHSLGIAKVIRFKPGTRVMDVGTGGGFPGIPLAVLFPETEFLLIDSIAKKIKVVEGVAAATGLKNVTARQGRAEEVDGRFDFIVSRAVTAFPRFVSLVASKVSRVQRNELANGILYLKGGDFAEELAPFIKKTQLYELSSFFEEEFFETKKLIHLQV
ncbi:MAG: 16S rRNA (guanine(527)-N(7))-methyltransferase RsmG [Prolixibacteraceae bacterium]